VNHIAKKQESAGKPGFLWAKTAGAGFAGNTV